MSTPDRRPNLYVSGRAISDEYRYILERRYAKKFPGNMLTRPGLLLNPWEVRSTDVVEQSLAEGEVLQRSSGDRAARGRKAEIAAKMKVPGESEAIPEEPGLDFLATTAPVIYNLTPGGRRDRAHRSQAARRSAARADLRRGSA
jgi:hypothetical protein